MLVELDIFSGRPNPRWEVDEPVVEELRRLEDGLGPAAAPSEPPGLGYRGFLYTIDGDSRRAFLGQLERRGAKLADPGRTIERRLLQSLPEDLAPLAARVEPPLRGPPGPG